MDLGFKWWQLLVFSTWDTWPHAARYVLWGSVQWLLFCLAFGGFVSLCALGLDQIARPGADTRRWVWVAAIATTVLLPALTLAGRYLPALLHPDHYLSHPRSEIVDDPNDPSYEERQQWYFEGAAALGISEAPSEFHVDIGPARIDVNLGNGLMAERVGRRIVQIWLLGSLIVLLILLRGLFVLERRRRRWRQAAIGGVPVLVAVNMGPAVVGMTPPRIVLPAWALAVDAAQRRQMLLHEGEHIRAGDQYLLLVAALALVVMPWHPILWWQVRRLRLAIEIDCDARVLDRTDDPRSYGELLLQVARRRSGPPLWAMGTPLAFPFSMLEQRLRAMGRRLTWHRAIKMAAAVSLAAYSLAYVLDFEPPEQVEPYAADRFPVPQHQTAHSAELQLRTRSLVTKLLREWSRTMPEVRSHLARRQSAVTCEDRRWLHLEIVAADGGSLLRIRADSAGVDVPSIAFEHASNAGSEPGGRPRPDSTATVLRAMSGSWDLGEVLFPCVDDFDYRVVSLAGRSGPDSAAVPAAPE